MKKTNARPRGDHFDIITPEHGKYMDWIGGPAELAKIRALMAEAEPSLSPCPFCGAPAVLRGCWGRIDPGVKAECSSCHCCTRPLFQGTAVITGRYYPLTEQIARAAQVWNCRREAIA